MKTTQIETLSDQAVCDLATDYFGMDVTGWPTSDLRDHLATMIVGLSEMAEHTQKNNQGKNNIK